MIFGWAIFFDSVDTDFLRRTEVPCNAESTLIPSVTLPSLAEDESDDFNQNGTLSFEEF